MSGVRRRKATKAVERPRCARRECTGLTGLRIKSDGLWTAAVRPVWMSDIAACSGFMICGAKVE
jgi:hypothetical protein